MKCNENCKPGGFSPKLGGVGLSNLAQQVLDLFDFPD